MTRFALVLAVVAAPLLAQTAPPAARRTVFYMGLWPDKIIRFDPQTDTEIARVQLRNGLSFGLTLAHDKKHMLAITAQRLVVEVVDLEKMEVVDEHPFAEQGRIIRVSRVMERPGGKKWYVKIDRVKNATDHYVVEKSQWLSYDVASKKIEKRMNELPKPIRFGARISPDGTMWHVFGDDIVIVDPETLKEVGRIDLKKPLYSGMGRIRPRGEDFFNGENPNAYRMIYTMTDPVLTNRRIFGLVDIDIAARRVASVKEWGADPGVWNLRVARNRKVAAAMSGLGGGRGRSRGGASDPVTRLVVFDLTTGRRTAEAFVRFRPRRWLAGLSPDGEKIYVGGAGNDLEVFDRNLERVKTITFDADLSGGFHVVDEPIR